MTFTADNLPEAARATEVDGEALSVAIEEIASDRKVINALVAIALNRLDAAHNGRLSALLNGTAPVATDQPPEVTADDVLAVRPFFKDGAGILDVILLMLKDDRARVWRTHRPAPADSVRFALEKVTEAQWRDFLTCVDRNRYTDGHGAFGWPSIAIGHVRAELAKILPVAKSVKPLAELTDEALIDAFHKANAAYGSNMPAGVYEFDKDRYEASLKLAIASLRASLSAYAPPPRKVEVTPEVMKAFVGGHRNTSHNGYSDEPEFQGFYADHLEGMRAALAVANTQAAAREIEAVAEVARLKGEVRDRLADIARLRGDIANLDVAVKGAVDRAGEEAREVERLTKERDDWRAKALDYADRMQGALCHAAALEALLTVDGVGGQKVKLWLPFERCGIGPIHYRGWEAGTVYFSDVYKYRQTPAPEPEKRVRWSYPVSPHSNVFVTTDGPCLLSDLPEEVRGVAREVRDNGRRDA
jgi:hypothetical protein